MCRNEPSRMAVRLPLAASAAARSAMSAPRSDQLSTSPLLIERQRTSAPGLVSQVRT